MSESYENTTEIELESLEAIYVNELTYSRNANGQLETIELLLHPATGHDVTKQYVCMTLVFTISSKYPNEPPEITIRNPRGLGEEEVSSLVEDMILKAEEMKGEPMLYTLIEMAKDSITEGNLPHCPCVVCLEHFHQRDIFHRTACYHYFHNRCLYKYRLHAQAQLEEEEKEVSERRHLDAGSSDKDKSGKILCPVCRSALDEESLTVTCSQEELEEDEKAEEFVMPADLREQQRKMLEMYEHQKAKGGIIDLEQEKNRYLLNPEDRMPVRSLKPAISEDATKSATSKQGTRDRHRDRPVSSGRQDGSSQLYRKGRGRGRGNFYSGRSHREWSGYEDRPGLKVKSEGSVGRKTNYPSGSGSQKTTAMAEIDSTTELPEQKTASDERGKPENRERIWEKERRMEENDRRMRRGHADNSLSEVRRVDGGFSRSDREEKLDEGHDNQRKDGQQSVDRKQDNIDIHERKDDDVCRNKHEIANESDHREAGRTTDADSKDQIKDNKQGGFSMKAYQTGGGHKRGDDSDGRRVYSGGSYQTRQKYYSEPRKKENIYKNDDKSKKTEIAEDVRRKQLSETGNVEAQSERRESENESSSSRSDRFDDVVETSREDRHEDRYNNGRERASAVRGKDAVPESGLHGASGVERPTGGRDSHFRDEHTAYGRRDDHRIRRGFDSGSSGYQRGSGSHRSRGSGAGPKERGKFQEGRGSYAGYSERSHVRHERPQQHRQQQQQWHHHNRHGEERERADRNLRAAREKNAEDGVNSSTAGQGTRGADVTSEAGSKDDEEADSYCEFVHPCGQECNCEFSGNDPEDRKMRKPISFASQGSEDEAASFYSKHRFSQDERSHKNSGSEIMRCDNIEDNSSNKIRAQKTYPAYSQSELRMYYVGFDEDEEENWDEEIDIYCYERYKIRSQHLAEYDKQAAPRRKYYENKITEKLEQQSMIEQEQRRILKERSQGGCHVVESPESKKDTHVKSILDVFKEEKAKELGISVTTSKGTGTHREEPAALILSTENFESKVDRLYKITKQNVGSGCKAQDSRGCETVAYTGRGVPHTRASDHPDSSIRFEGKKDSHTKSSDSFNRRTMEHSEMGTLNLTGQRRRSKLSVSDTEDLHITTSCSSLDDKGGNSDVLSHSECSLGMVAESKGVCYKSGSVSRRGEYRDGGVFHKDDCTDVGASGVSHGYAGDSHISNCRDDCDPCKGSQKCDGISYRGNHIDVVTWGEGRNGVSLMTGDRRDRGVSHISGHKHAGVSSRDIQRNGDSSSSIQKDDSVSSRDIHRDKGICGRDKGVALTSAGRDKGVALTTAGREIRASHNGDHTDIGVSNLPHTVEPTRTPVSFVKPFKKVPPLKFPKNRQGAINDWSAQIPTAQPAAVAETTPEEGTSFLAGTARHQSLEPAREDSSVTQSKIILSETTSTTLNARPPAGLTDLSLNARPAAGLTDLSLNARPAAGLTDLSLNARHPACLTDLSLNARHPACLTDLSLNARPPACLTDLSLNARPPGGLTDLSLNARPPACLTDLSLNARPPAGLTDLSSALLSSYMITSLLSSNLLASNQTSIGLNPSLLSPYGPYAGNFSNVYLSDLNALTYNCAQNVATSNSVTTNTCRVSDAALVNCVVSGGDFDDRKLEAGEAALGKENARLPPGFTG